MSYKAEVIADSSGEWCSNALRFTTPEEAQTYVSDLEWRWTSVRKTRVTQCEDPVTAEWKDGRLIHLKTEAVNASTSSTHG